MGKRGKPVSAPVGTPTQFSLAWNEWLKTEEARGCLAGHTSGVYLQNRLFAAFTAGYNAGRSSGDLEKPK